MSGVQIWACSQTVSHPQTSKRAMGRLSGAERRRQETETHRDEETERERQRGRYIERQRLTQS
eukprot:14483855-Alexandrium_andersonii.AAC.1